MHILAYSLNIVCMFIAYIWHIDGIYVPIYCIHLHFESMLKAY